jgi:hypothetical protein
MVERLARAGLPRLHAEAWIAAWDESTAGLIDFRAANDYWELGFQYAIEERRRGYHPPGLPKRPRVGPKAQGVDQRIVRVSATRGARRHSIQGAARELGERDVFQGRIDQACAGVTERALERAGEEAGSAGDPKSLIGR